VHLKDQEPPTQITEAVEGEAHIGTVELDGRQNTDVLEPRPTAEGEHREGDSIGLPASTYETETNHDIDEGEQLDSNVVFESECPDSIFVTVIKRKLSNKINPGILNFY